MPHYTAFVPQNFHSDRPREVSVIALFVLSDTHLSFSLNKPMDIFGRRWENHTEKIARAWHETVQAEDTVVIPGDISWGMTLEEAAADLHYLDNLPGQKIIGRGNHDYWWSTVRKMQTFFAQHGISTIRLLYNNAYRVGSFAVCGSRGWWNDAKISPDGTDYAKIINRENIRLTMSLNEAEKLGGEPIVFLHFPPVWRGVVCREIVDLLHAHRITRCYYGHLHTAYDVPAFFEYEGITFTIASADYLHFTPLAIAETTEDTSDIAQ